MVDLHYQMLYTMSNKNIVVGLPRLMKARKICTRCMIGKQSQKAISQKFQSRVENVLDLIHMDLCGPFSTPKLSRSRYFVTFTNDFNRKTRVRFLKKKYDTLFTFKTFKTKVEK
jgi:hypothetical protein